MKRHMFIHRSSAELKKTDEREASFLDDHHFFAAASPLDFSALDFSFSFSLFLSLLSLSVFSFSLSPSFLSFSESFLSFSSLALFFASSVFFSASLLLILLVIRLCRANMERISEARYTCKINHRFVASGTVSSNFSTFARNELVYAARYFAAFHSKIRTICCSEQPTSNCGVLPQASGRLS